MARLRRFILAATMLAAGALMASHTEAQSVDAKWTQAAMMFVQKMQGGDFAGAGAMASPATAGAFAPDKLAAIWKQLMSAGELRSMAGESVKLSGKLHVVDLAVVLGQQPLRLRIALDEESRVEGFFALPATPMPYIAPSYVDTAKFEEVQMRLAAGKFLLPAVLTLPRGVVRAPVVVLVHGSGPNDRDESIGPNRPFRDIAWGLASRGIAVLRYDKRTLVAQGRLTTITVDQEVVDDALTALDSARSNARVDARRVYLAGHSLGAMLAPEIAHRDARLAGVIMLAGTPRDLGTVMLDQYAYLKTLPANAGADAQRAMADAVAALQSLARKEPKPDSILLGAPASYFYDLSSRDALRHAKLTKIPMLFMQGARDYQVTTADLELWRSGLRGRANTSFKLYPDLNHLFMSGTGKATPTEYTVGGHVAAVVIDDMVTFIRR